jgi:FkbM family methyltransferase
MVEWKDKLSRLWRGTRLLLAQVGRLADQERRPIGPAIAAAQSVLRARRNGPALALPHGLITASFAGVEFMLLGSLDDIIERRLAYDGVWEPHLLRHILAALTPHSLFIDVGANIGAISIPVAKKGLALGVEVLSLEANAQVAQRLRQNVHLNKLPNVRVVERAAADRSGRLTFYQALPDAPNQGLSGLQPNLPPDERVAVQVEGVTLDDLLAELELTLPVGVLKVDVEGAELQVFQGARQILGDQHPPLFFECLSREKGAAVQEFLRPYGYRFFSLVDQHHYFLPEADLGDGFVGDVMAVAIPKKNFEGGGPGG